MQKSPRLLFLALLFLAIPAFSQSNLLSKQDSRALRFLENYATTSGNIPLTLGDLGLFVHVDFADHSDDASESDNDNSDYGSMVLALYTDQTFFGRVCQGFEDYCLKYNDTCQHPIGNETTVTFPYFTTPANPIQSDVFLDYTHWLQKSPAYASTACSGNYTVGGYGLLGMGVSPFSLGNFLGKKPNFAIQVAKSLSNGTFAFNVDVTNNAKSSDPAAVLSSDNQWHVYGVGSIKIKNTNINIDASLIFDLGSDSIGLPQNIYNQVINQVKTNAMVGGCSVGDDFRPICNFSGDIRNLPTITLNIGGQTIDIPPEIYVVQTQDDYFYYDPITLKLKVLSTDGSQGMLVTPDYANYIILGYPVLSYYYTVFEASHPGGGTITLYPSSEYVDASDLTWLFIVVGLFGLVSIGMIFYFYDKKYRKKVTETTLLGAQETKVKVVRRLH